MSSTYAAGPQHSGTVRGPGTRSRRRQRMSTLEIITLVVIATLLVVGAASVHPRTPVALATKTVQVQTGDTLWSIAQRHPIEGLSTAQTVESIARENRLSGAILSAGVTLVVPEPAPNEPQMASR